MADKMSIDHIPIPPRRAQSEDSPASSPERDRNSSAPAANHSAAHDSQQPKRKGGRKPIYATSEERKQRNRQAQAAFRERRTEYIKQLEETIRVHESNLHNLQTAHRTAAEECLMLRYKNSLLERILLEKGRLHPSPPPPEHRSNPLPAFEPGGRNMMIDFLLRPGIDVQAELHAKTGSPDLGPSHMPQNLAQPQAMPRPVPSRHHHPRKLSSSGFTPKTEPCSVPLPGPPLSGPPLSTPLTAAPSSSHKAVDTSPKCGPTPSSNSDSPTNITSAFSPSPSDSVSMRGSLVGQTRHPMTTSGPMPPVRTSLVPSTPGSCSLSVGNGASFYPTPSFQNHLDQLDHEFDGQGDLMGDVELKRSNGSVSFAAAFNSDDPHSLLLSPTSTAPLTAVSQSHEQDGQVSVSNQVFPSMTQLLDQNLDWDPFGLSASMAFPSHQPFQFDQPNLR